MASRSKVGSGWVTCTSSRWARSTISSSVALPESATATGRWGPRVEDSWLGARRRRRDVGGTGDSQVGGPVMVPSSAGSGSSAIDRRRGPDTAKSAQGGEYGETSGRMAADGALDGVGGRCGDAGAVDRRRGRGGAARPAAGRGGEPRGAVRRGSVSVGDHLRPLSRGHLSRVVGLGARVCADEPGLQRAVRRAIRAEPGRLRQHPGITPIRLHAPAPFGIHRRVIRIRHNHRVAQALDRLRHPFAFGRRLEEHPGARPRLEQGGEFRPRTLNPPLADLTLRRQDADLTFRLCTSMPICSMAGLPLCALSAFNDCGAQATTWGRPAASSYLPEASDLERRRYLPVRSGVGV